MPASFSSFADELLKIAFQSANVEEVEKKLKPGDVLHSRPTTQASKEK